MGQDAALHAYSMPTVSVGGLFLTLIVFLMIGTASSRPRRRFCELSSRAEDSEDTQDNWTNNDNKKILVPYNLLVNLIRDRMSTSQLNQKRSSDYWEDDTTE
ncbi:hypothetical protein KUTeg_022663 [Tegillarca granosa]|uniref:Uncharacterized protein n=1 Tax=Tegillarca granosa TaxID=220873 RepID=A0ABQ9E5M0_TEGGR|nr:hypothetical protein KUTeg_022663 [Tegillarca granosa]